MGMTGRIRRCFLALTVCFLMSGCWDRRELNDLSVVTGIAIDKGESSKFKLYIETVNVASLNPKRDGNLAPSVVYSLEGNSLSELARKMNLGISRTPIYSHMRTVILSEAIAREGKLDFLDFLQRNREIRNDFNILVAKGNPKDLLTLTYPFQKVATLKIYKQLQTLTREWGGDPDIRLNDVIEAYNSKGRQPVMAMISIQGTKPDKSEDNLKSITPAVASPVGMAVFKDMSMIGTMDNNDVRSFLWTQNKIQRTSLTVPMGNNKHLDVRVLHSKSAIKARMDGYKPRLQVIIKLEGIVEGVQTDTKLDELPTYEQLQERTNKMIQQELLATIGKAQKKFKADIFGFGDAMYRRHPAQFAAVKDDWDETFARGEVEVSVETVLTRTGTEFNPFLSDK